MLALACVFRFQAVTAPLTEPGTPTRDAEAFVDEVLAHESRYGELLKTRGAPRVDAIGFDSAEHLRRSVQLRIARLEKPSSLLLYSLEQQPAEVFVTTADGPIQRFVLHGAADIGELAERHRHALKVPYLQAARAPQRREPVDHRLPVDEQRGGRCNGQTALEQTEPTASEAEIGLRLRQALLPDAVLAAVANSEQLLLLASGSLASIPLAALPLERGGEWLGEQFQLILLPSLPDFLQRQRVVTRHPPCSPLVVGDPIYPQNDKHWRLPQLPGAYREAIAVAKRLGVKPLLGAEATTEKVMGAMPKAELVWLATHGMADTAHPMSQSWLALTATETEGWQWNASSIQQKTSKADVVVLSACQTGLGMAHAAGVIGLARAFERAGSGTVVMSLWNVSDEATSVQMLHLLDSLLAKTDVPQALQAAQQKTRKLYPDPALWASFAVLGLPRDATAP